MSARSKVEHVLSLVYIHVTNQVYMDFSADWLPDDVNSYIRHNLKLNSNRSSINNRIIKSIDKTLDNSNVLISFNQCSDL